MFSNAHDILESKYAYYMLDYCAFHNNFGPFCSVLILLFQCMASYCCTLTFMWELISCRWHIVTMTIDADLGEATCYLDGGFDGYQNGLPLCVGSSIWDHGTEVWVGVRPPTDIDAFGRSDSEGVESKMHIMDIFLWGRCLSDDEVSALYTSVASADLSALDYPDDNWQWADSPSRVYFFCILSFPNHVHNLNHVDCSLQYICNLLFFIHIPT
jgi:hypothetical protein